MVTAVCESSARGFAGILTEPAPGFLAECLGNRMEVSSQTLRNPLVSVAVVVCNVDRFLAQAIESIPNQTCTRLHERPSCGLEEARVAACFLALREYIAVMDAEVMSIRP